MAKQYPVYEARTSQAKPCGHQHATEEKATNCAINIAYREPGKTVTVRKYVGTEDGDFVTIAHFEANLKKRETEETLADMIEELMS